MVQFPLAVPETDWRPTPVHELPAWPVHGRVAIDVETRDEHLTKLGPGVRRGAYVVGVAFAIEDGPAHYLPVRHGTGGNLDPDVVRAYLVDQASRFRGDVVGANLQYDVDFLAEEGIEFSPRFFRDVQVAEPLIDELQFRYSLDAVAARYGMPGKDEELLREAARRFNVDEKAELWKLPSEFVGAYAERDVLLPLALMRRQERKIEEQDLQRVFDVESRLLPVLVKMRRRGVRVDFDRLARVSDWSKEREREELRKASDASGMPLGEGDATKPKPLAAALEAVGITVPRTPKNGQPSIKNEVLRAIDHPVAHAIVRARVFNKLRKTFVASIARHATNGRIHPTFNQLRMPRENQTSSDEESGAKFGRLSSTDPNLQQQPIRDREIGPRWRSIFLPDEGALWACNDFSQQEPRWLTHFAAESGCRGADAARTRYVEDPKTDNHSMMRAMIWEDWAAHGPREQKKLRDDAKQIFLALCYGMGGGKLCRSLGYPTKWELIERIGKRIEVAGAEGQALIDLFKRKVPYVPELAKRCQRRARQRGYLLTPLGRRCRFPRRADGSVDWLHKALNRLIQGSAADQGKVAMVEADAAGFPIQLQVHDELDLSVESRAHAEELAALMRDALPCTVPAKVDVEVGPSWGEIS